jgi:hypothetical protein
MLVWTGIVIVNIILGLVAPFRMPFDMAQFQQ